MGATRTGRNKKNIIGNEYNTDISDNIRTKPLSISLLSSYCSCVYDQSTVLRQVRQWTWWWPQQVAQQEPQQEQEEPHQEQEQVGSGTKFQPFFKRLMRVTLSERS